MNTLKAIMSYAIRHGYIEQSPFKDFRELPQPKRKPSFLEVDEAFSLIKAGKQVNPQIHMFIAIGIYTGLRKSEIMNLKWKDINWDRSEITVECTNKVRTKSNKFRIVPIESKLKELLQDYKKTIKGFDFVIANHNGKPYSEPIKGLKAAAKLAGIKNKDVHTRILRTTACSFWAMNNVPMRQAQVWMGHSDINITSEIYSMIVPSIAKKHLNSISLLFEDLESNVIELEVKNL